MSSDKKKKGFSGLESMVSDAHIPTPHTTQNPDQHTDQVSGPAEPKPEIYKAKLSTSGGSGKWWAIVVGIIIVIVWAGGSGGNKSSSPRSYTNSVSNYGTEPEHDPPTSSSNKEEIPPIGNGLVLNQNQIRYCLSQKIRIEAWQNQVNHYSTTSVNSFNLAVDAYNLRCSNFRYINGLLESVGLEVETNRYNLTVEGARMALLNP